MSIDYLAIKFMNNLSVGTEFMLFTKKCRVESIGKWSSGEKGNKTITISTDGERDIKFYKLGGGYHGNPKSMSKTAHSRQYNFLREVGGIISADLLYANNPFHDKSEILKIAKR